MPLSPEDQVLIADMKQREYHLKRRQRAADAILYQVRRYQVVCVAVVAVVTAVVVTVITGAVVATLPDRRGWWLPLLVNAAVAAALGALLGHGLLRTRWGHRLVARKAARIGQKYSGDLHAGRRWLRFYYQGEDISTYVPQILYFIDADERFDSVPAALAFARENRLESTRLNEVALDWFGRVAAQTTLVAVSSTDDAGTPSIRPMRFVKSDRPGVWYVTTAPEGNKVAQLDRGRVALLTQPTESGETIGSNRVQVRRVPEGFAAVVDLYRAQVPGYVDGLTEEEQQHELVYEFTLQSAKVDSWLEHEVVVLRDGAARRSDSGVERPRLAD